MRLSNQVALVTGSSRGIGAAIAKTLAAEGARVVINSVSSIERGQALAQSLPEAIYIQADVSQKTACDRLVEQTIQHYGRLDILINNAAAFTGIIPGKELDKVTEELFLEHFTTNVLGPWHLSRLAMGYLAENNGVIINVSSIAGIRATGSSIPYAVSKAALNHLTRLMAKNCGPVRINAIAPGLIGTERAEAMGLDKLIPIYVDKSPLQRIGEPNDVADAVLGLVISKNVTGEVLTIDAGYSLV